MNFCRSGLASARGRRGLRPRDLAARVILEPETDDRERCPLNPSATDTTEPAASLDAADARCGSESGCDRAELVGREAV